MISRQISAFFIISYCLTATICFSGTAKLSIMNEKENISVVKYIIKYGNSEQKNPDNYPYTKIIIPENPVNEKTTLTINLGEGVSGSCFFSVKDYYSTGEESSYSESSFPIVIPKKPMNLKVK